MPGSRLSISLLMLAALLAALPGFAPCRTVLVPAGSDWKYLDDGSDQGTAWREASFDDSSWASGPAQLGYGDGDEATLVGYGGDPNDRYVTTYFRHTFDLADPSPHAHLELRLLRDDGAVVYLNGTEIHRTNMPAGAVDLETPALYDVLGGPEDIFTTTVVDAGALAAGANTIAVEVHQLSPQSDDISFDLEVAGIPELLHPLLKGPCLIYTGVPSEMKVLWQLSVTDDCSIEWGYDETYSLGSAVTGEQGAKHRHAHTVTGLAPATKYYYRVIARSDTVAGSFRSAPDPASTTLKFMAYGDCRSHPDDHQSVTEAMTATYTADPDYQTMTIVMGDLVTYGNHEQYWQDELFDSAHPGIGKMFSELPYQSCKGNHEESGALFADYFPYPYVNDFYWSFDYGPAHFIVLDQYVSYVSGSPQYDWLVADLAASTKPWKFICLHEPGYSAGGHPNNVYVRAYIEPLCRQYNVPILFAGHNHYYARAEVNGITHITTGGGGGPLNVPDPGYPGVVTATRAFHYCRVAIDGDLLTMTVYTPSDSLIDSFTVSNPATAVDAPGAPLPLRPVVLHPVAPNPFNPAAVVRYTIEKDGPVDLAVFDVAGRRTAVLHSGWATAGTHSATWNGATEAGAAAGSGTYFVRIRAAGEVFHRKITLIR